MFCFLEVDFFTEDTIETILPKWDNSNDINNFGTPNWYALNIVLHQKLTPSIYVQLAFTSSPRVNAGILAVKFIDCLTPSPWKTLWHGMYFFFLFLIFPLCQESRYSIWKNIFPSILFRAKMSEHEATYYR